MEIILCFDALNHRSGNGKVVEEGFGAAVVGNNMSNPVGAVSGCFAWEFRVAERVRFVRLKAVAVVARR